jgi:hypothetical protein
MPGWLRALLIALLVLLLVLLLLAAWDRANQPQSLAESTLAGPRSVTGAVCIEEAVDVSGSMAAFRAQRESAERALFGFAHRELAPYDQFSTAFFADTARLALAPTALSSLDAPPAVPPGLASGGTTLAPAVTQLVEARPAGDGCAVHALIVITDGLLNDSARVLDAALAEGSYARVFAVIPSATGWGRPGGLPPSFEVYHFHGDGWTGFVVGALSDAKPLDVVFGEILGSLTGQTLVQTNRSEP